MDKTQIIARTCYAAIKEYNEVNGWDTYPAWNEMGESQREQWTGAVAARLYNRMCVFPLAVSDCVESKLLFLRIINSLEYS